MGLFIRDGLTYADTIPADPAGEWPAVKWCYRPALYEDREHCLAGRDEKEQGRRTRKLVLDKFVNWDLAENGEPVVLTDDLLRAMHPIVYQRMVNAVLGFTRPAGDEAARGKGSSSA